MSNKKPRKKRKLKLKKFLIFLFIVIITIILVYLSIFSFKIKNIYITGNTYYSDYEILNMVQLNNHTSFITTSTFLNEMKLKKDPLIKSATIKKAFWGVINIKITEYQVYFRNKDNTLFIENGKTIKNANSKIESPLLITDLKDSLFTSLVKSFAKLDSETISKISEIEYLPSVLDKERFLLLMTDGNYAYITIDNIDKINYYSKIVTQLAGKKGTIHFDSFRDIDAGITIDILE